MHHWHVVAESSLPGAKEILSKSFEMCDGCTESPRGWGSQGVQEWESQGSKNSNRPNAKSHELGQAALQIFKADHRTRKLDPPKH